MGSVSISVEPQNALVDESIEICIKGLKRSQSVTIHSKIDENGAKYSATGCFKADSDGVINVSKDVCLDGTYRGNDGMGLFWSVKPERGSEYKWFVKKDVCSPLTHSVYVYDGFFSWDDVQKEDFQPKILVRKDIKRWFKAPDVQRIEVKHLKLRGTLFIPKGKGPFPALVEFSAGAEIVVEHRAAMLASRGFLTLALRHFTFKDNQKTVFDTDFKKYQEAAAWLNSHPLTKQGGIGVVGLSAAAKFACGMATYIEEVVAAVVVNGTPYHILYVEDDIIHHRNLKQAPNLRWKKYGRTDKGLKLIFSDNNPDKLFTKNWKSEANFLCVVGLDDECGDPSYMEKWYSEWPQDQRHKIEMLKYQDAGHLIDLPYNPHQRFLTVRFPFEGTHIWGGKLPGHAYAQIDFWQKELQFLRDNVPRQESRKPKSLL